MKKTRIMVFTTVMAIMLLGCAQSQRSWFVVIMDQSVGTKSFSSDVFNFLSSNQNRYQEVTHFYDENNQLNVEYNFQGSSCRVKVVFDKELNLQKWLFIENPDKCRQPVNWGGPW